MEAFIKESDFNWLCLALKDDCSERPHLELIHVAMAMLMQQTAIVCTQYLAS